MADRSPFRPVRVKRRLSPELYQLRELMPGIKSGRRLRRRVEPRRRPLTPKGFRRTPASRCLAAIVTARIQDGWSFLGDEPKSGAKLWNYFWPRPLNPPWPDQPHPNISKNLHKLCHVNLNFSNPEWPKPFNCEQFPGMGFKPSPNSQPENHPQQAGDSVAKGTKRRLKQHMGSGPSAERGLGKHSLP
jgi:hypothetical protein